MDCSLPGSSVHWIFQKRILEWVAISFSRRSFQPRDWTQVSLIVGRHFTIWATRECRALSQLFHSPLSLSSRGSYFFFTFCHKCGVICISEVIDISPSNYYSYIVIIWVVLVGLAWLGLHSVVYNLTYMSGANRMTWPTVSLFSKVAWTYYSHSPRSSKRKIPV